MDLIQAVKLAQEGNKEAFDFLYQSTYRSKYYLAKKYMKNEEAAEDAAIVESKSPKSTEPFS